MPRYYYGVCSAYIHGMVQPKGVAHSRMMARSIDFRLTGSVIEAQDVSCRFHNTFRGAHDLHRTALCRRPQLFRICCLTVRSMYGTTHSILYVHLLALFFHHTCTTEELKFSAPLWLSETDPERSTEKGRLQSNQTRAVLRNCRKVRCRRH